MRLRGENTIGRVKEYRQRQCIILLSILHTTQSMLPYKIWIEYNIYRNSSPKLHCGNAVYMPYYINSVRSKNFYFKRISSHLVVQDTAKMEA